MVKTSKNSRNAIRIMIVVSIVALATFAVLLYVNDYYKATETAKKAILGNETVTVEETDNYYLFSKNPAISYVGPGDGKGIIFYPGGKVEYTAYEPLKVTGVEPVTP